MRRSSNLVGYSLLFGACAALTLGVAARMGGAALGVHGSLFPLAVPALLLAAPFDPPQSGIGFAATFFVSNFVAWSLLALAVGMVVRRIVRKAHGPRRANEEL